MSDKTITELTAASALDGTELAHVVQGGNSRRATVGSIVQFGLRDEDDFAANDNTKAPTQQSAKAYIDSRHALGTSTSTASGASINFTSIPSGAKAVHLNLDSVSLNATSAVIFQLGTSGGLKTSGYVNGHAYVASTSSGQGDQSAGFAGFTMAASDTISGFVSFRKMSSDTDIWTAGGTLFRANGAVFIIAGNVNLPTTLDRLSITTSGGTNTFDGGAAAISYEL